MIIIIQRHYFTVQFATNLYRVITMSETTRDKPSLIVKYDAYHNRHLLPFRGIAYSFQYRTHRQACLSHFVPPLLIIYDVFILYVYLFFPKCSFLSTTEWYIKSWLQFR